MKKVNLVSTGNCVEVYLDKDTILCISYHEPIALIYDGRLYKREEKFSLTTTRHHARFRNKHFEVYHISYCNNNYFLNLLGEAIKQTAVKEGKE